MKRNLFLLIAVAAALSACSKTETIGTQDKAIQFTSAYIGNAVESKAVNMIEQANINEFIVYGGYNDMTHVFNGVSVTGDANTDNWTYDVTRYWVANKTYKFAAYAPSAAGSAGTITPDFGTGALNFTGYTSDPSNQNDLIYATTTQATESDITVAPAKIQFVFGHLLSMIKFTFNSGFGNDIKVTVDNLKVSGMIAQGDYAGDPQSWTPGSATVTEGAPFSEMSSNEAKNSTSGNTSASSVDFAVIPQTIVGSDGTGTKVAVSFNVRVQDAGGDYIIGSADAGVTLTAKLPGYTWTAGNRYNYTVTIKGENVNLYPIEFGKPSVTPITDADFDGSDEVTLPTA